MGSLSMLGKERVGPCDLLEVASQFGVITTVESVSIPRRGWVPVIYGGFPIKCSAKSQTSRSSKSREMQSLLSHKVLGGCNCITKLR